MDLILKLKLLTVLKGNCSPAAFINNVVRVYRHPDAERKNELADPPKTIEDNLTWNVYYC